MKRRTRIFLLLALVGVFGKAFALPIITLDPEREKIHPGENLSIDVNISGLQSGGTSALLGAFSLDVLFDPNLNFIQSGSGTNTFGSGLGNVNNGEALVGADPLTSGIGKFSFYEVSLLDTTALAALQGDSFRLATLTFYLPYQNTLQSGSSIIFATQNVVLSDDLGNQLGNGINPSVAVKVSEPSTILLFAGLIPYVLKRRLKTLTLTQKTKSNSENRLIVKCVYVSALAMVATGAYAVQLSQTSEFNGHRYYLSSQTGLTWDQARAIAASDTVNLANGTVLRGHLLTINSLGEQTFIRQSSYLPVYRHLWLGGYQFSNEMEPAGNWAWITGESVGNIKTEFSYNAMSAGQPGNEVNAYFNEINPNLYNNEDSLQFLNFQAMSWEDFNRGDVEGVVNQFVIEYDSLGDNFFELRAMPAIVSNSVWKTSANYSNGWQNVEFDDTNWSSARSPYPFLAPYSPSYSIPGTNAQFMWHDPAGSSDGTQGSNTAYFRYTFYQDLPAITRPLIGMLNAMADDDYDLYVNGKLLIQNHDGGNPELVNTIDFSKSLKSGKNVIAIQAVDGSWSTPNNRGYEKVLVDGTVQPQADLIVSSSADKSRHGDVRRFDAKTGTFIDHFASACNPVDLVYGPDQKLYVVDSVTGWISDPANPCSYNVPNLKRFNGVTGQAGDDNSDVYSNYIGSLPFGSGGAAVGPDGNFYVSDIYGNSINRYKGPFSNSPGEFIDVFVASNSGGLREPGHLTFGPDNNLYVLSGSNNTNVLRFQGPLSSQPGAFIDNYVPKGRGGADYVHELLFGRDKRLYLLSSPNYSSSAPSGILKYQGPSEAAPGAFINQVVTTPSGPLSFAIGPDWDFYVGGEGSNNYSIVRYDGLTGLKKADLATVYKPSKIIFSAVPQYAANLGDFNNDGCVDKTDLGLISGNNLKYDLNGDGLVNIADSRKLVLLFTNPLGVACNSNF